VKGVPVVIKVVTRAGAVPVVERGEGPPVVLLHAASHDHRDFDALVSLLEAQYRTIALDWPAHGRSTYAGPVSAPLFAGTLADVVRALDLPPAVFIGNSVGGFAAARLAIDHPDRVAGLVLVNAGGFTPVNVLSRAASRVLGSERGAKRVLPTIVHLYMHAQNDFDRAVRDRAIARVRTPSGLKTAAELWRSFASPDHDLRALAGRIGAPTLIIWGSRDTAIPLPYGRATHRLLPKAKFTTLPTGHVPFATAPRAFLDLTTPHLTTVVPH
jgi:pimeloyl-ACP methyl ester carboxylesterase